MIVHVLLIGSPLHESPTHSASSAATSFLLMTTDRKRARVDADAAELSGKEAASTSHAAAASIPAIVPAASASLMLTPTPAAAAAAAAASDEKAELKSDSGSESDSDDEQSEIVVVRMPASLVNQMREKEGRSVDIQVTAQQTQRQP